MLYLDSMGIQNTLPLRDKSIVKSVKKHYLEIKKDISLIIYRRENVNLVSLLIKKIYNPVSSQATINFRNNLYDELAKKHNR
jgi:hypothetical protein